MIKDSKLRNLKVAIVHDWLTHYGGAERCLEKFCEIFPQAEIYTLVHKQGSIGQKIESHQIITSFLQKLPFARKHYRWLLPLMPLAIEQFKFKDYDLVISSSHAVAKGVITPTGCTHISYIYTPMRYIWFLENEYFGDKGSFPKLLRWIPKVFNHYLRVWDKASAYRVDKYLSISEYVAQRVKSIYGFESEVVYPPVDVQRFEQKSRKPKQIEGKNRFFLMVTNYEPNKNTEIAIKAFIKLNRKLKIVGAFGRRGKKLQKKYQKYNNIEFLGHVSDERLIELYQNTQALIAPGVEDFGMAVLEANASTTPVITYAKAGHLESVKPLIDEGKNATGIFFYDLSISAIIEAIKKFDKNDFDPNHLKLHVQKFSSQIFKQKITQCINEELMRY
jgi:glycosyltransferase involved in cell wall biosynthesis